ncbi:MAG: hypothetical protein ONB46_16620 [candidate division KSB1 bacterium]|nr:hypothetical protein [candidate division KSB1 bacterium]MDZ7367384.1 hypothetical protein [candidate division KSB1 bacterium]MDZ7405265.1 hypothetical protein [candidate division KSB1 bacterium]
MEAYEKAQEQFKREKQAYWAMRDRLLKDYYGLWVAVVNEQVVVSGKNRGRVGYEAFLKTGSGVCFCAQVGFEDRVFRIRQVAPGYFDLDYDPFLPKASILTNDLYIKAALRLLSS